MNELKIYKLNCASCNSNLEIPSDIDKFNCSYCGTQQIVERSGGIIALREIIDAVSRVQTGTDKTAAELALIRLQKEQNELDYKLAEREKFWNHHINEQIESYDVKLKNNSDTLYAYGCLILFVSAVLLFLAIFLISTWLGIEITNQSENKRNFTATTVVLISICLAALSIKYLKKSDEPIRVEKEELLKNLTKEKNGIRLNYH